MVTLSVDAKNLMKNLRKITGDATVVFPNIVNRSAEIIVKDIKEGASNGIDIKGSPFKSLKPKTIQQKRRKGYSDPSAPLVATGQMTGAFKKGGTGAYVKERATMKKNIATVSAPNIKAPYGSFHNVGVGNLPQREWFGISQTAERKGFDLLRKEIERLIRAK